MDGLSAVRVLCTVCLGALLGWFCMPECCSGVNHVENARNDTCYVKVHIPVVWCASCDHYMRKWLETIKMYSDSSCVTIVIHAGRDIEYKARKSEYLEYCDNIQRYRPNKDAGRPGDIIVKKDGQTHVYSITMNDELTKVLEAVCRRPD